MTPPPAVIAPSDTVADALAVILKHRILGAPVVDGAGVYQGMFLRSLLILRLLPGIAALEDDFANITRILSAATAGETLENLHQRYVAIANHRVEKHMDTKTQPVQPDTPLIETVHQLHLRRSMLPVVDATTKKLLGVVSTWDLLKKISADT